MRRVPLALVLLASASAASAQLSNVSLGVSVNGYFFADSRLRNVFGNPALTYGANLAEISAPKGNKLSFAYDFISASRDDSNLYIIPLTLGYAKSFGDEDAKLVPYFRLAAGGAYYDVGIHNDGIDRGFKTFGGVGKAEVGLVFSKTIALKANYYLFQNRGVPLSGFEIGLVYNFTKL